MGDEEILAIGRRLRDLYGRWRDAEEFCRTVRRAEADGAISKLEAARLLGFSIGKPLWVFDALRDEENAS